MIEKIYDYMRFLYAKVMDTSYKYVELQADICQDENISMKLSNIFWKLHYHQGCPNDKKLNGFSEQNFPCKFGSIDRIIVYFRHGMGCGWAKLQNCEIFIALLVFIYSVN